MPTGEKITLRAYEVVKNVEQRWSSAESDAEHSERVNKIIDSMRVVKMYFFIVTMFIFVVTVQYHVREEI